MVSINWQSLISLVFISIFALLAGCATQQQQEKKPVDIYAAITKDQVQYRNDETTQASRQIVQAGSDYVNSQLEQVRMLLFSQNYEQASQLAERLIRQAPNDPNTYYWLARIRMEMNDYQQAQQMAQKGLSVSQQGSTVRKALRRIEQQADIASQ